jgi:DNA helicase HerA-like ATPase
MAASEPIGKTSSPEREPNTTTNFTCWLKDGTVINPFDFVAAEQFNGSKTVGIVNDMQALSDAFSHLSNYVSSNFGEPSAEPYAERLASMVAQVMVLRNSGNPEILMPLPGDKLVRFASPDEIQFALGIDQVVGQKIPAGVIHQSNGMIVPVQLDSAYLLGPEGAHINASGVSGLATKTSYLMFLMTAIHQTLGKDVAFVIFNVKQSDLLHIHEKADDLTKADEDLYSTLGLEPKPFKEADVSYFLPSGREGKPDSDRPPSKHQLYNYTLADVHARLDLLFADVPDPYFTLDTYIQRIREDWEHGQLLVQPSASAASKSVKPMPKVVRNWQELRELPNDLIVQAYNLHAVTAPRIKRELTRLTASPLFPNVRTPNEVYLGDEVKKIRAGKILVIDMAQISSRTQPFIVGDVMRSIDEIYREGREALPKKMVIFIDELNSIAPSGGSSAIAEQVVEIARKGRSRGTILFGAEQFKSEIHDQIVGNSSVHAIGRTGSSEVRKTAYAFLDDKSKQNVMNLGKGEIVLSTPTWRSPIKIQFPRPPYKKLR